MKPKPSRLNFRFWIAISKPSKRQEVHLSGIYSFSKLPMRTKPSIIFPTYASFLYFIAGWPIKTQWFTSISKLLVMSLCSNNNNYSRVCRKILQRTLVWASCVCLNHSFIFFYPKGLCKLPTNHLGRYCSKLIFVNWKHLG